MSTRIAVITDAYANFPALDAALAAIRGDGVVAVYHTGDAIGIGPFPTEVLDRLLHEPRMHLVMGNHDV
jgi:fructose-1,6-bisphosphatase